MAACSHIGADGPCQPGAGAVRRGCPHAPPAGGPLPRPPLGQARDARHLGSHAAHSRGERDHHYPNGVQAGRRARRRCTSSSHRRAGRLRRGERAQEAPTGMQAGCCELKEVIKLPPAGRPDAARRRIQAIVATCLWHIREGRFEADALFLDRPPIGNKRSI